MPNINGFNVREGGLRTNIIAAASRNPLSADATTGTAGIIPNGTPMAPISGGSYKPIRRTLCVTAGCTTGQKVVDVVDTTPFRVGDVVGVVPAATPLVTASALGTIDTIQAGVSITLVGNATTAVSVGDIVEVVQNALALDAAIMVGIPGGTGFTLTGAPGSCADTECSSLACAGNAPAGLLNYNTAGGISLTRLKYELAGIGAEGTALWEIEDTTAGAMG